ncbi:ABC transporter permease subunit [Alphaproteobacteria bacterium]|nr:ABC transporter permease subunit [Alphaproteobacteria bacterium]
MKLNLHRQFTKAFSIFLALLIITPIFFGFLGFFLPSFGYFPSIGHYDFDLNYFKSSFDLPGISKSFKLSIFTGFFSTILALFFSQVILLNFFQTKIYNYIRLIIAPLLALPHITMAVGLIFLFSPSGLIFRLISPWLTAFNRPPNFFIIPDEYGIFLILGLILKETPFFLLLSMSALEQLPARQAFNVGRTLQHSSFSTWFILIFPLIYKKIRLVIFIVIAFAASVIDMSLLLAPSTPSTLAIRIFQIFQNSELESIFVASNLALIQLCIIIALILFWILLERIIKQNFFFIFLIKIIMRKKSFFVDSLFIVVMVLFLLSIIGIASSFLWSISENWYFPKFFPSSFNFNNILVFLYQNQETVLTSVYISFLVSFLSIVLILIWIELTEIINLKTFYFEWIIFIPLFIPQISFLIGFQSFLVMFNFQSFLLPLIIVELLYVLPYCFIILAPALREIKKEFIKVGCSLGKNRFERLVLIKIPLVSSSLLTSTGIGMVVSLSLYAPVYFIGAGRINTLTVEAVNLALSGSRQDLGLATVFQVIIPILILLIIAYLNKKLTKWRF